MDRSQPSNLARRLTRRMCYTQSCPWVGRAAWVDENKPTDNAAVTCTSNENNAV